MPQGIQSFLPVGPDGLPIGFSGGGTGTGGTGSGGAVDVNVTNQAAALVLQPTLSLATARTAAKVDTGTLKTIFAVTVRRLTGAASTSCRLHFGSAAAQGIEIDEGETRDGLSLAGLYFTNSAGDGSCQLEIYGV